MRLQPAGKKYLHFKVQFTVQHHEDPDGTYRTYAQLIETDQYTGKGPSTYKPLAQIWHNTVRTGVRRMVGSGPGADGAILIARSYEYVSDPKLYPYRHELVRIE